MYAYFFYQVKKKICSYDTMMQSCKTLDAYLKRLSLLGSGGSVEIRNARKFSKKDRHGWAYDFHIDNPPANTVIYQVVKVSLQASDGDSDEQEYTEAWHYRSDRKITDYFLVPVDWRKNLSGTMAVETQIWAQQGPMDSRLRQGKGLDYWGRLHGSFELLQPTSKPLRRKVLFQWENEGVTQASAFTKGKDITRVFDLVDEVDIAD